MSAEQTIDRAKNSGVSLGEDEARVALHPGNVPGHRAWLGIDFRDYPVAYFESIDQEVSSFAISQVIDVESVDTVIGQPPEHVRTVKVTCRDARLSGVFIAFMDDVISQLGAAGAVSVLTNSAASWRNLLRLAKQGLSDAAAAGLYGELMFLNELIFQSGPAYLETWQKDGQDVHDFIADDVRVEVKTSAFQNRQAVSIHGLKQLAVPESADLVLAVAEIEKHGNGETLDDVVDRILDQGAELGMMSEKLAAAGFVRGMTSAEEEQRFTLRSWRYWEITEGLPVLNLEAVGAEVALAISDVRYSLNLSSLGESRETFDWSRFTSIGSG